MNRTPGIIRFNHVSVQVTDTRQALDFYHGVLGMAINSDRPSLDFPGAWLDIGDGRQIHLLELSTGTDVARGGSGGRGRHFALDVVDLDDVTRALDNAGVDYTLSRSGRRALFCSDPDGNVIELFENP